MPVGVHHWIEQNHHRIEPHLHPRFLRSRQIVGKPRRYGGRARLIAVHPIAHKENGRLIRKVHHRIPRNEALLRLTNGIKAGEISR